MKKKLLIALVVGFVAILALRVGLGMYSSAKFRAYSTTWQNEIAAERKRAALVERPMIHGLSPIDSNVAPLYLTLFARTNVSTSDIGAIGSAKKAGVRTPDVERILAERRADIDALRECPRYVRCDWETPWEKALTAPLPNLIGARSLCDLLLIEARSMPPREAAERCLDVVRVGADHELGQVLITKMIGIAILNMGIDELGRTIVRAQPGELDLDAIARDIDRLAADRTPNDLVRGERLGLRSYVFAGEALDMPSDVLGGRIILELGVIEIDAIERGIEDALPQGRAARDHAFDEADKKVAASMNPIVRMAVPSFKTALVHIDEVTGTIRLVQTLIAVEKQRAADGTYPEKVADLAEDPSTGQKIGYERSADGKGYKAWCKRLTLSR